jgi:cobalamin synthase
MSGAALFFWMVTALHVSLSASVQIRAVRTQSSEGLALSKGQRKDGWFACALMTLMLVLDRLPLTEETTPAPAVGEWVASVLGDASSLAGWVYLVCAIVMAWLVRRALERRRLLP